MSDPAWWFDYDAGEIVRSADGARWKAETAVPRPQPEVDFLRQIDAWVARQPPQPSRFEPQARFLRAESDDAA